ncbi:DEAD/DEAH box helicase family protein [Succinivibrio dextrinosolvens]|uniref:DEAD/DEAH box helicase family protein n=1 Tax=Succinivibrio dextrinosolvens TaxID=83771 RepID=UPI002479A83B|nr:DEAD/DEAH box helicase family protein [Succinivibrio dextrinosolvens]
MPFLFEKIDTLREAGVNAVLPEYIKENINPKFFLREYQIQAFENFITYFENPNLRNSPTQCLFHMATGSGKTLIMAGLMLYLYKRGYRNFLFFVHLNTILEKTKDNFTNQSSSKYLFSEELSIDSEKIRINKVDNFQDIDDEAINICFTSIQGLHSAINLPRENGLSEFDFEDKKIVFISDEAHHLNVDTKKSLTKEEQEYKTWEGTVDRLFTKNNENVLLQFTATCDIDNPVIKNKYENKIIFDYPLREFYLDKYSKEINTIKTDKDSDLMNRVLLALILSQYRLKVFQDNKLTIKPVVLLKSKLKKDCTAFQKQFHEKLKNLTPDDLTVSLELGKENPSVSKALTYLFEKRKITLEDLVSEIKNDFSEEHCLSANDGDAEKNQLLLNSLEDKTNPYRLVFEVRKLDEGWDVLNLFDIVRLYSDRQSESNFKTSRFTLSEAQLIGRGARYCPFNTTDFMDQEIRYKRKFDEDSQNELRICEELFYHCQNDSRYISELRKALNELGLKEPKYVTYKLKDSFKQEEIYKSGKVFYNSQERKDRKDVTDIPRNIFGFGNYDFSTSIGEEKLMIEDKDNKSDFSSESVSYSYTVKNIAELNYSIVHKALRSYPILKFNIIKKYFPNIKTLREFITDDNYLGYIPITIKIPKEKTSMLNQYLLKACKKVFGNLSLYISNKKYDYKGSEFFTHKKISEVFKDKTITLSEIVQDGLGESQKISSKSPLDLSKEDWFIYEDNYGTSEEKAFVKYFHDNYLTKLKEKFEKVFLIRNERALALYSFEDGARFEPDYLLILQKEDETNTLLQYQIFVEPKGEQLLDTDKWKEDFLLELHDKAIPLAQDANYNIWGVEFFNSNHIDKFSTSFGALWDNVLNK